MNLNALGCSDITTLLNRLAFLESEGQISGKAEAMSGPWLRGTRRQMRALGLVRNGPLAQNEFASGPRALHVLHCPRDPLGRDDLDF